MGDDLTKVALKVKYYKIGFLGLLVALTLAIHYGLVLENIFGHAGWIHAIHGRFCYIPIAIAAVWFGVRGGLVTAAIISAAVMPFIFLPRQHPTDLSGELVEIVFYFAIALLTGALTERELHIRRRHGETKLELERAQRLSTIGRMAAGVAHEIKNPLASIKGALEIMSDETTPSNDRDEFREIAFKEIRRVDGTVRDFLTFARPRKTELTSINLSKTVVASLRQIDAQIESAGVATDVVITDSIHIKGDAEKIHQLMLNLMLNALEASNSGSTIQVKLAVGSGDRVELVVKDSGQGIDQLDLEKVFEPFYTTKSAGTGLGLAIARSIVDDHGGAIRIESKSGKGTEVRISFPPSEET
ncbi:MAG: DUF4118 domain-containing protein [candidate division Zixibacteria bacterium]|nr:DUF4118 domain-containing protein [candidate division Zixibacteria bacterium]MBU1469256.1 DUF4118 domain-containing protein [candidate division Zixibacteria bacterium]MBU2626747.1 DUF4118 domain-containing protein [candidate division Zixibacteria bacterium]